MKKSTALVTTVLAMASFPLLAQQSPPAGQQPASPETQQSPTSPMPQSSQAAAPITEMSPVNGELVSKLDSKTAKAGDSVVVQTKAAAKTADGTEIPKGSKLMGHVIGVHASEAGDNSQVVLKFDHLELKGGQSVPIQSQIESIGASGASSAAMSEAPAAGSAGAGASSAGASSAGSTSPGASGSSRASGAPQSTAGGSSGAAAQGGAPAAGTVVARTGNIAIRTTSVPGVLVANNEPGQRDPRMAQASSILLGAKQDVQLDGGTQMVVGVASAGGGTQ